MIPFLFLLFLAALSLTTPGHLGFGLKHYHGHGALILMLLPLVFPFEPYLRHLPFVKKLESLTASPYPHRFPFTRPTLRSLLWTPVLGPLLFYFLWVIRMRRFLPPPEGLGDSLLLLEHLPAHAIQLGYLGTFDEILALFWRSRAFLWLNQATGMSAADSIGLISCLAGTLHGLAIFLITDRLRWNRRLAAFALLFFVPALQLYAGYVENYSFASFFLFLTVVTGIVQLERWKAHRPVYPEIPAFFAALGAAHHMILVFSLPALVFLVIVLSVRSGKPDWQAFLKLSLRASAVALVTLGIVWYYFFFVIANPIELHKSFAFRPAIYPLSRLISIHHLKEGLNVAVLVAPALIGMSSVWFPGPATLLQNLVKSLRSLSVRFSSRANVAEKNATDSRTSTSANNANNEPVPESAKSESFGTENVGDPTERSQSKSETGIIGERLARLLASAWKHTRKYPSESFALISALSMLGHSFIWNPVIGFPADWDLFSFYQGPLHIYLYLRIFVREEPYQFLWLRRALIFTVLPCYLWVSQNARFSSESQFHMAQANRNLVQFLGLVQTEGIFFRIPTLQRQRTYIEVRMFIIRAWNQIPYLRVSDQKKEELRERLRQGLMRFQTLALQDKATYDEQLPDVYYSLGDLNAEITELQKRRP